MKKPNRNNSQRQSMRDANARKSKARWEAQRVFGRWINRTFPKRKPVQMNPFAGPAMSLAAMEYLIATPAERMRDALTERSKATGVVS